MTEKDIKKSVLLLNNLMLDKKAEDEPRNC